MSVKKSKNFLKNKVVLITGAAGSVGSELSKQIYKMKPKKLLLLDNNETELFNIWEELPKAVPLLADIRIKSRLREIFNKYKPDFIFNCAAYKHVIISELFPEEFWETNVNGLLNVLITSKPQKFIFVSSDKAVNPISVMGKTKKIGEQICQEFKNCIIVRFANVLGSRGSVIPIWQKQLDEGKDLTVTDKRMERYFMTMEEACSLILKATKIGKGGEIFVLDMGKPIKILDLAKEIIKKSDKKVGIKMIGAKPGEKFKEELMTKKERKKAIKQGKLWIIR